MEKYTIYCTQEQTKKAVKLGAPIDSINHYTAPKHPSFVDIEHKGNAWFLPTTEQMIIWLEEQNILIEYTRFMGKYACRLLELHDNGERNLHIQKIGSSRKEVTLAAIDAALNYLTNKK